MAFRVVLGPGCPQTAVMANNETYSLLWPSGAAGLSATLLLLHTTFTFIRTKGISSLWSLTIASNFPYPQNAASSEEQRKNQVVNKLNATRLLMQVVRLLVCVALFVCFNITFLREGSPQATENLFLILTCLYTVLLAIGSVATDVSRGGRRCARHATFVLVIFCAAYAYRNVWPLLTFDLKPQDRSEGWMCWMKMALLTISGIVVPLFMPHPFVPVNPGSDIEPTPEQTCSWASFLTYSFLDSTIWKAWRMSHLPFDEFPPLADHDHASHLVKRSYRYLDLFSGATKRHMFFSFMVLLWREYAALVAILVVYIIFGFAGPFAINRLLLYLESGGEGAIVKPWVWITLFFIGPVIHTSTAQGYTFISTRILVRTEAILTQLIFDHALRIRVKADDSIRSGPSPAGRTPSTDENSRAASPSTLDVIGDLGESATSTLGESTSQIGGSGNDGRKDEIVDAPKRDSGKISDDDPKTSNMVGKINNLVTTDLGNITDARNLLFLVVFAPMDIILCTGYLYYFLGYSTFVGLAVMLLLFPLPGYLAKVMQRVQVKRMEKTDARVQTVTEIVNVLRMVKFFGWENKINAQVDEKRVEELKLVYKRKLLDMASNNLNYLLPLVHMISTYITYTLVMKKLLSASLVFSTISIFEWLRYELNRILTDFPRAIQGKVSLERLQAFLRETELLDAFDKDGTAKEEIIHRVEASNSDIGFWDATFVWSGDADGAASPARRNFTLRVDGELRFKRATVNLILGPTGSGKTSLLMALLGEMHFKPSTPRSWFNLPRNEGVAYAAQESWVQNDTIKNNIVFGSPYDEERYNKVVYQCCLTRDLELFNAGDETEVGEKGVTLSGGQKARITLARAVYSSAAILLLDDVLAALDVHTAKWIVEKCFKGDLVGGRTILLVTHNIALTSPIADFVVSLGMDGRVKTQGTVSDALKHNRSLLKEVKDAQEAGKREQQKVDDGKHIKADQPADQTTDGKLIIAEEMAEGHVGWPAMKMFFTNMGGRLPIPFWLLMLCAFFVCELTNTVSTWFLGYWASQYESHGAGEVKAPFYLSIYAGLLGLAVITRIIRYLFFVFGHLRACRALHQRLLDSVFGTTFRWLDTTPTSRIIARCTQDIRALDGPISDWLSSLLETTMQVLLKLGAVAFFAPGFVPLGILLALAGGAVGQIYMKAQLSVKREMSVAKAPVLGHFGATMAGLVSVRAYGVQDRFKEQSMLRIDRYTRCARPFYNLNRWVGVRIDVIGGLFATALGAYLVYGRPTPSAADTGFSMTMAFGLSGLITWWVRIFNEFEIAGNSLERIQEYVEIEQEPKPTEGGRPPAYWPASGDLRVEKLSARYSPGGPKVLQDISFHIKSGERVGIVGRTGSGKSTLSLSLLRCIPTEGEVYYDGLPVASLNLDSLRSSITIIPQVPELLGGTLRQNLDPFSQHDDVTLNDALRAAGLFSLQGASDEAKISLDSQIASGGGNLSVGQRQILALARAIVRQSKLLILDEATSAIDYETDSVIQTSLRQALKKDVTVVTVAHRLQTIMDADKIIVLDAGRLVEFDSPTVLLQKEHRLLKSLVDESGDKEALYAMAARSAAAGSNVA